MSPKLTDSHRWAVKSSAHAVDLRVADIRDQHRVQWARIHDLDLVVLPLHPERRQIQRVFSAGPAALESQFVVVEEVRLVIGRQHRARTHDIPPAGPEPVREEGVHHGVFADVVLDREFLRDVARGLLGRGEIGGEMSVRLLYEVVARTRVVEPAQAAGKGPLVVWRIADFAEDRELLSHLLVIRAIEGVVGRTRFDAVVGVGVPECEGRRVFVVFDPAEEVVAAIQSFVEQAGEPGHLLRRTLQAGIPARSDRHGRGHSSPGRAGPGRGRS